MGKKDNRVNDKSVAAGVNSSSGVVPMGKGCGDERPSSWRKLVAGWGGVPSRPVKDRGYPTGHRSGCFLGNGLVVDLANGPTSQSIMWAPTGLRNDPLKPPSVRSESPSRYGNRRSHLRTCAPTPTTLGNILPGRYRPPSLRVVFPHS